MRHKLFLGLGALTMMLATGLVIGDDDEHERNERHERESHWFSGWGRGPDIAPVANTGYREECGSCHFAYQPGLLPARSWDAVMNNLADHFGDNAELDSETETTLRDYLKANAADSAGAPGRSAGFAGSVPAGQAPMRITETRYFERKHHEIPPRMVRDNPQLGSLSKCAACHTQADQGSYDEHQVNIPGVGRWDD